MSSSLVDGFVNSKNIMVYKEMYEDDKLYAGLGINVICKWGKNIINLDLGILSDTKYKIKLDVI